MDEVDIEVVDVRAMRIDRNPSESASFRVEIMGGQIVNLHFSLHALSKLEGFLAKAVEAQLKNSPRQ